MTDFIRVQLDCFCIGTVVKDKYGVYAVGLLRTNCPKEHTEEDFISQATGEDPETLKT